MKIVFIVRSTLYTVRGGDTIQVDETAANLRNLGVEVEIKKADETIDYAAYNLLHFFNITRPADILFHINRSGKPFIVSTILINYSLYDKYNRHGLSGRVFRFFSASAIEYAKTVSRFLIGKDKLVSTSYLWKGQKSSIKEILKKSSAVVVQAKEEYDDLVKLYHVTPAYHIVQNGINSGLFKYTKTVKREMNIVLCVARFEGLKNQYNLIKALNNTSYNLILIGDAAPNQNSYYQKCKKIAASNVSFIRHLPQQQLAGYYASAQVHVLPSWFEVCGLSSMEAAAMGCQVVITNNGYASSYFKDDAFYCEPSDPASILGAVDKAMTAENNNVLLKKITTAYSWKKVAADIQAIYKNYIP